MKKWMRGAVLCLMTFVPFSLHAESGASMDFVDRLVTEHPGKSGVYVLDTGADALQARAWLVDHAQHSIEVQYFIWSTDNIGILAADALLRAADRGVHVRVIVDDLMIDAADKVLLALARHPKVEIKIYNPQTSVGVTLKKRLWNLSSNFRGVNQRMHNKIFIVDGKVGITGGRNMAGEYFDYNHTYNFRDRDALLAGPVVTTMLESFEKFWGSELSRPVETLFDGLSPTQKNVQVTDTELEQIYHDLHDYAKSPENFAPEVHVAIDNMPKFFGILEPQIDWGSVEYLSDLPGKNGNRVLLSGGGLATTALAKMVEEAHHHIVIQSPYLVLSNKGMALFHRALARGVHIRVNTNSLASTDNIPAFSGYRNQRAKLLKMGVKIYEYRPDSAIQRHAMEKSLLKTKNSPISALHAKTMVVDSRTVFIGTFNLDPRSENLNTEGGVIIHSEAVAQAVEAAIGADMRSGNSWNAATDDPDQYVPLGKRSKVRALQLVPIKPIL